MLAMRHYYPTGVSRLRCLGHRGLHFFSAGAPSSLQHELMFQDHRPSLVEEVRYDTAEHDALSHRLQHAP